jgi:hypothetical protein
LIMMSVHGVMVYCNLAIFLLLRTVFSAVASSYPLFLLQWAII